MAYYRSVGEVPKVRHTLFKGGDGRVHYEELMGEEGFSSDSSLLYHRNIPSALVGARTWDLPNQDLVPNEPLIPRHLRLQGLFDGQDTKQLDAVGGRRLALGNSDVRISYAVAGRTSPLYRNAVGDECVFIQEGQATLETVFGELKVSKGDFAVIPRGTTHRWVITETARFYIVEANSHIGPARQYLSKHGQLMEHAPFCERDIRAPEAPLLKEDTDVEVYVKHRGESGSGVGGTVHVLPNHTFDVVGLDGSLYPWLISINDIMPITGKVHQPPPVHQVFEGSNFVVCAFVPRKVDYHPLSVSVPYYHSNVDSDEIMFYVDGDYEARKGSGIGIGSVSIHPGGHTHGPQPGAVEASLGMEYFDELAVMVDTFRPLHLGEAGTASDDGLYASSWTEGRWLA